MFSMSKFFYGFPENCENIDDYKLGGYHPTIVGDLLPKRSTSREPRYRILQKLGHSAFATVWSARDMHGEFGLVAIKIYVSRITDNNNEITMLRWLKEADESQQYDRNIIYLLDNFMVQGFNGTHECLVTEIVLGMKNINIPAIIGREKEISYQILLGLSYLHGRGVTHGDLHRRNITINLPYINDDRERYEPPNYEVPPDCHPVISRDPTNMTDSLPAYLLQPVDISEYFVDIRKSVVVEPLCVKINNFKYSFRQDEKSSCSSPPMSRCAPEVIFRDLSRDEVGSYRNCATDIWGAASTLFELNFDVPMLSASNNDLLVYEMFQIAGPCPKSWEKYWDLKEFCKKADKKNVISPDAFWTELRANQLHKFVKRVPNPDEDIDQLIDLLRNMLKINPKERPAIKDLLAHPWFSDLQFKKS